MAINGTAQHSTARVNGYNLFVNLKWFISSLPVMLWGDTFTESLLQYIMHMSLVLCEFDFYNGRIYKWS